MDELEPGDVIVVNDAATLPASIACRTGSGEAVEVRLGVHLSRARMTALLFGEGDHRVPTEHRPAPPVVHAGDTLSAGRGVRLIVERVHSTHDRLVDVRIEGSGVSWLEALYAVGRPIQYAYVERPLSIWEVQTPFAYRPMAFEAPSAARLIDFQSLDCAARRGVEIVAITHAAGISSTGDVELDATLPWPEPYEIHERAAQAVRRAKAAGGRVVAVGTSVARALEGASRACGGTIAASSGVAEMTIDSETTLLVIDAVVTGLHESGTSHRRLLSALTSEPEIQKAWDMAETLGLEHHEFGDGMWVWRGADGAEAA